MKKLIMFAVVAGLVLALAPAAQAVNYTKADYRWTGSGAGDNWATAANWNVNLWDADLLAGAGDWTGFGPAANYPGEVAPLAEQYASDAQLPSPANPVVVNTVIPNAAFNAPFTFSGNGDDNALKVVNGGDITFDARIDICYDSAIPGGRMTIFMEEGGRLATPEMLFWKRGTSYGLIEMTGGVIEGPGGTETALATYYKDSTCDWTINLHGGTIRTSGGRFFASYNPPDTNYVNHDKLLDIQGSGVLEFGGVWTPGVAGVTPTTGSNGVARPDLEALGTVYSDGDLRWVYDSTGDITYAWAVPEPATMALSFRDRYLNYCLSRDSI